jgi:hypothetical protein
MQPDALSPRRQGQLGRVATDGVAAPNLRLPAGVRRAALFAALIMLADCSAVPLFDSAQPDTPPQYGSMVSEALKKFAGYTSYSDFEISGPRWVHATTGWNWLVCVRYNDGNRQRFYSFFVDNNKVVNQRYDIVTDQCGMRQYVPFDATTGTIGSPTPFQQQPIY